MKILYNLEILFFLNDEFLIVSLLDQLEIHYKKDSNVK